MNSHNQKNAGFSFMELVIVLLAAALLLGGIMAGSKVMRQAQLNTIVEETEAIQRAVQNFIKTYNALPGDMADATDKLGSTHGGFPIENGNGNGFYDGSLEAFNIPQHLAAAGFISGSYDISNSGEPPYAGFIHSSTDSTILLILNSTGDPLPEPNLYISVYKYQDDDPFVSDFTPTEVKAIDEKYDDGKANSGNIQGTGSNCANVSGEYDVATYGEQKTCAIQVSLNLLGFGSLTSRAVVVASTGCPDGAGGTVAAASTRTTANCSNYGFAAKALTEVCQTGGYWEVQSGQTCP